MHDYFHTVSPDLIYVKRILLVLGEQIHLKVITLSIQVFGISTRHQPSLDGHVFPNPVDTKSYMVMLVYKNGSLTREGKPYPSLSYIYMYIYSAID